MFSYREIDNNDAKDLLGGAWDMAQHAAHAAAAELGLPAPRIQFFRRCAGGEVAQNVDLGLQNCPSLTQARELATLTPGRTFPADRPELGHADARCPGVIWINVRQSPAQLLRTIAHETMHVRQHASLTIADALPAARRRRERQAREFERDFMTKIAALVDGAGALVTTEYVRNGEDCQRWYALLAACREMREKLDGA